jgi:hypothetical protein
MPAVVTFPRLGREPAGLVQANLVYGLTHSSSPRRSGSCPGIQQRRFIERPRGWCTAVASIGRTI